MLQECSILFYILLYKFYIFNFINTIFFKLLVIQNTFLYNKFVAKNSKLRYNRNKSKMEKENREYKDSMFVDLFYKDETSNENLLSLYNALHGTNLKDASCIHKLSISDVLYKNFRNDISFEVDGKVFVLGEHQSTVNKNMPLRCLMYVGRAYEQIVENRAKYRTGRVPLPTPEFYVFYNGPQNLKAESQLRLSESFMDESGKDALELVVKVININTNKGHEILEKCKTLKEYSLFVDAVRKYNSQGSKSSIKDAINECIHNGILVDYLERRGSEVVNMLTAEYDYDMDIRVQREEAREEGREEEREKMKKERLNLVRNIMLKLNKTSEEAMEILGFSEEDRNALRKELEK